MYDHPKPRETCGIAAHTPATIIGMDSSFEQIEQRMQADRAELVERMISASPQDGTVQVQPSLQFSRFSHPTELHHGFYDPCLCVIAQGAKTLSLGNEKYRYGRGELHDRHGRRTHDRAGGRGVS